MGQWTDDDPGAGSTAGIHARMSRLAIQSDHAAAMQQTFSRATLSSDAYWSGAGHDAWARNAARNATTWQRLQSWTEEEYRALSRYAAAIESIAERAKRQKAMLSDAQDVVVRAPLITQANRSNDLLAESPARPDPAVADAKVSLAAATRALHELARERQQADNEAMASVQSIHDAFQAPALPAGLTIASLRAEAPTKLLDTLSSLSKSEIQRLLKVEHELAQIFWKTPPDSVVVASWWQHLTSAERDAMISGAPQVIGNLGGVSYSDRITANNLQLAAFEHRAYLSKDEKKLVAQIKLSLKRPNDNYSTPPRGLIDLNLGARPPLAAVAIGNVDTAGSVTWAIPGMDTKASDIAGDCCRFG